MAASPAVELRLFQLSDSLLREAGRYEWVETTAANPMRTMHASRRHFVSKAAREDANCGCGPRPTEREFMTRPDAIAKCFAPNEESSMGERSGTAEARRSSVSHTQAAAFANFKFSQVVDASSSSDGLGLWAEFPYGCLSVFPDQGSKAFLRCRSAESWSAIFHAVTTSLQGRSICRRPFLIHWPL
jgi:hypothetical protein